MDDRLLKEKLKKEIEGFQDYQVVERIESGKSGAVVRQVWAQYASGRAFQVIKIDKVENIETEYQNWEWHVKPVINRSQMAPIIMPKGANVGDIPKYSQKDIPKKSIIRL